MASKADKIGAMEDTVDSRQREYLVTLLRKSVSASVAGSTDKILNSMIVSLIDVEIESERQRRKKLSEDVGKVSKALALNPSQYEVYCAQSNEYSRKQILKHLIVEYDSYRADSKRVFDCITSHHRYAKVPSTSSNNRHHLIWTQMYKTHTVP